MFVIFHQDFEHATIVVHEDKRLYRATERPFKIFVLIVKKKE